MSFDIHDYFILGIGIENKKTLVIKLADPLGVEFFELLFTGVKILYVDGFSMQNIVFDVSIFYEKNESFEFNRACGLLEVDPKDPKEMSGSSCMIFIQASAGAEVACLMEHHWKPKLTRVEK